MARPCWYEGKGEKDHPRLTKEKAGRRKRKEETPVGTNFSCCLSLSVCYGRLALWLSLVRLSLPLAPGSTQANVWKIAEMNYCDAIKKRESWKWLGALSDGGKDGMQFRSFGSRKGVVLWSVPLRKVSHIPTWGRKEEVIMIHWTERVGLLLPSFNYRGTLSFFQKEEKSNGIRAHKSFLDCRPEKEPSEWWLAWTLVAKEGKEREGAPNILFALSRFFCRPSPSSSPVLLSFGAKKIPLPSSSSHPCHKSPLGSLSPL